MNAIEFSELVLNKLRNAEGVLGLHCNYCGDAYHYNEILSKDSIEFLKKAIRDSFNEHARKKKKKTNTTSIEQIISDVEWAITRLKNREIESVGILGITPDGQAYFGHHILGQHVLAALGACDLMKAKILAAQSFEEEEALKKGEE